MNDLRLILLGLGILVIAGIYLWEVFKRKRDLRSRIENYPSFNKTGIDDLEIRVKDETDDDYSDALADFNAFLNQSRQPLRNEIDLSIRRNAADRGVLSYSGSAPGETAAQHGKSEQVSRETQDEISQIIVLYVTPRTQQIFRGPDILQALDSVGMHYGSMNIFHYYGKDQPQSGKAIFSLTNMHEPGLFDLEKMGTFTANGLAFFMCLPAELYGDIVFDLMLDTAEKLADILDGNVRDAEHELLNPSSINKLREIACCY
jgi:cell division protein ZipA